MKLRSALCLTLLSGLLAPAAQAQFLRPADAVEYRQAGFVMIEMHFKRINAMAQGKLPFDAKLAADNMAVLNTLARLPFAGFIEGTDKPLPNGPRTQAKPEAWTEAAKFKEAQDRFLGEIGKLDAAVRSGKVDDIKVAAGGVGQSCKACHESFKSKGGH